MALLFDEVLFYTTRFKTQITCGAENDQTRDLFASGIWIASPKGKTLFYVTNRHLVDYSFDSNGWKHTGANSISLVDIELRKYLGGKAQGETKFFNLVTSQNQIFYPSDGSDLAVIAVSTEQDEFKSAVRENYVPKCMSLESFLAGESYFTGKLKIIDSVSFIGYPKTGGSSEKWCGINFLFGISHFLFIFFLRIYPTNKSTNG